MGTQEGEIPVPPRGRSLAEAYGNPELGTPEREAVDRMLQRDLRQEAPQEAGRRSGGVDFSDVLERRRRRSRGGGQERGPLDFREALEARRGRTLPRDTTTAAPPPEPEQAEEGLFQSILNFFQREGEPEPMGADLEGEEPPLLAGEMREPTEMERELGRAARDPTLDPDVRQQADRNLERARAPEARRDPFAAGPGELGVQPAALPDQRDELLQAVDEELRAQGHDVPPRESSVTETPSGVLTTETISPSGIPRERVVSTPFADEELRQRRARAGDTSLDVNLEVGKQLAETGMSMALGTLQLLTSTRGEAPTLGTRPEDPAVAEGMREEFVPAEEQPPQGEGPLSGTLEDLQATREEIRDYYGVPESTEAALTGAGARLGGELTMFMAPEAALTRIAKLPRDVAMAARIAREVATGGPIDAMIAASDRENSMAGFAADFVRDQAEAGATMRGPQGEEISYDALARQLDEIAETPWKRAVFDATLGSFMAAGAMPVLDRIVMALNRARGASRSAGEQILREARIQSVTDNYRQAADGPLETRPVEGVSRLEELPDRDLVGMRRELTDELARARERGVMALAVERDLQRVQRALLGTAEEGPQAAARATPAPEGPPTSRLEELERGTPRISRLEELRQQEEAPPAATRMDELRRGEFDERAEARGREAGLRTELDAVRRESETDPLTDLPNKRGEARALERRPQPEGTVRLSFMGDLDHFKAVNDQLSQQAGDEYLQELSDILKDVAREEDVVTIARVGGDEFRVTMDVRAGTDPQALYDRFNRQVNQELARRGMDQVGDTELGMTFFEPGKKTQAKRRRLGQARRTRAEIEAERNPPPARLAPEQAQRAAFEGAREGDIEVVRRATRAEVEAGRRGMRPAVDAPIGPRGERPSADVFALQNRDINQAGDIFQYKVEGRQAAGRALAGVQSWDYTKGGVMSVYWWGDPAADGFPNYAPGWYVVNGHNRERLAKRVLGDEDLVNVMEIHADDPVAARAVGAQQNIAEGRGTPVDAAKYFRDSGLDAEDIAELDIPMSETNVQKGLALARLHPAIFQDVVQKRVKLNRAVILGESGLEPEAQLALHRSDDINDLNQGELEELIRIAQGAGTREATQETLFGTETFRESNLLERVKISRRVKRELVRDRRIFGPLSRQSRAQRIEAKGVGQVEAEKAGEIATEAERFEEVYNALSTRSGPVADILNRHARAVGAGEATLKEAADAATEEVKATLREIIEEGGLAREVERGREGVRGADGGAEAPRDARDAEELRGGGDPGTRAGVTRPEEAERLLDVHVRRIEQNPNDQILLDTSYDEVARALRSLEAQDALTDEHLELARRVGDEDFIEGARAEGRELAGGPEEAGEARYTVVEHDGPRSEGRYHVVDEETGEVAARSNYIDEAHRQASELNRQATGRPPEAEGPEGADDLELFERPGEFPERERAFEASRAQGAFTSPEAADELAEDVAQMSLDFADGSVAGFPTPAARLADIREDRQARAWVDIRGQRINGPEDAHRLLYPFRRPESEALHLLYLDENGRVLAHNLQTSGAVDYVKMSNGFAHRAYLRAKRLGADEVIIGHNHPSGIPQPSPDDKLFLRNFRDEMGRLEAQERVRGMGYDPSDPGWNDAWKREFSDMMTGQVDPPSVTTWRGFVTNHERVGEMRTVATGTPQDLRRVDDQMHHVDPPRKWDWTERTVHARGPSQFAARISASSFPEDRVDIAYMDIQNNVLAVEPHSLDKVSSGDPARWLDQQARAYGAWGAVFVTRGDKMTYHHVTFAAHQLRKNPDVQTRVRDVVGLLPDGADHPRGYISAHSGLPAHRAAGEGREAWALFERNLGLPEGEELGQAAIRDPSSNRVWKGSSHFNALEKIPDDVPRERLEDGWVTTNGRFVGRQEGMRLEREAGGDMVFGRSEEVRRSPAQAARQRAEQAKEVFGTTDDPLEAGYILRDGTMLDFSGKRQGGSPGRRAMDHREINQVFDEGFGMDDSLAPVRRFMGEGHISLHVSRNAVAMRLATTVTNDQVQSIQRAVRAMMDQPGQMQKRVKIDVYDPKEGYVNTLHVEDPQPGRMGAHIRQVLREAEEAGYDPHDLRQLSRGGAQIPAGLSDSDALAPKTYPSAPRSIATDQANHIRDVAERLKAAEPEALEEAADQMAPLVKPGARLIPIPDHTGSTQANRALASELARRVNGEVVDVLHRVPNEESSFARRRQGEPGLTANEIRHELVKPAGDLENAYLVDNVVATGATATSARRALGEEVPVLSYAKDSSVEHRRRLELEARQGGGEIREEGGPYGQEDIFGGTAPAEGGDQFQMFGREAGPLEGLSASEQRAANTIAELQDDVDRQVATPEEMERYNDAVKLLRRNDPIDTEELIRRARQDAHENRARTELEEEGQTDIFGPQAGAALPRALVNIAAMGGGGTVGALLDDENPWRGAAIGAIVGGGLATLPRAWTDVMAGRKETLQDRVQRAAENAARGEPPGAPEYRGTGRVMTEADLEEAVNFEKFDVDPTGKQRLEDETRRVAQQSGVKNPHKVVSLEEAQALARQLALDPSDVLPQVAERMTGAELTALGNIVTDNVRKSVQILEALNHPALTLEQEKILRRNLSTREAQNNFLLEKILRGRSQKGRDLSHLRLTAMGARGADGSLEPEPFYIQAKRFLGEDAFTTEHAARINKFIADDDLEGLAEYISGLRKASFTEKLVTWYKASLMSAPITQIRNLTGNTSMAVLETVKDVPAYVGDRLLSLAFDTGLQAKAAPRPGRLAQASWEGVKKGANEAEQVLRTGVRIDDAAIKYDLTRKEVSFNNVFADVFTKTIFRSMIAGDRFFKGIAFMRALDEMAQVTALNEGLERGTDAFKQRTADLIKAPTDEMAAQAIHDAEIATFTNRNILGDVGVHIKRQIPFMEAVIPFTNTPANIALRTVDYTPFGFLRTARGALELSRAVAEGIDDAAKRSKVLQIQRQVANDFGRNVTGTLAVAAVGYKLAEAGMMTGSWPTDRRTQREWMRRGIPSNGIYIPEGTPGMPEDMQGSWSTIENISPWGNIMAFGANLYDVVSNPETSGATDIIAGAGVSIATTVSEQSFLTGLSEALSALNHPERASGDAFRRTVASFLVPNIVKKISEGMDPHFREFETLGEDVGRRLPPAARFGPLETKPRLDVFGRPQEREGGIIKSLFDPFLMRTDKALEDEVLMELSRTGASVPELQKREGETREAFRQRQIETGRRLYDGIRELTTSASYTSIPEVVANAVEQNADLRGRLDPDEYAREMQQGLIEDLVSAIKRGATRRAQVQDALEGLESGELQPQ